MKSSSHYQESKRPYRSPMRQRQAKETRQRILNVAGKPNATKIGSINFYSTACFSLKLGEGKETQMASPLEIDNAGQNRQMCVKKIIRCRTSSPVLYRKEQLSKQNTSRNTT